MVEQNESEIDDFFVKRLKQSGYLLESLVEDKLKPLFHVERDVSYIDKDESKGRRNDFVALSFIPEGKIPDKGEKKKAVVSLKLIIECKSLPDHGWIFFPRKEEILSFVDTVSAMKQLDPKVDPAFKALPVTAVPNLFQAGGYAEFFLDNRKNEQRQANHKTDSRSNKRDDNLYECIHTVTKATRHQIDSTDQMLKALYSRYSDVMLVPVLFAFQAVIIFQGRMYASEVKDNEIKLRRIKFAQVPKRYTSKNYDETRGFIHIVQFDALDEYIKLLRDHYWSKSEYIIKNQDDLLSLVEDNLVTWKKFGVS